MSFQNYFFLFFFEVKNGATMFHLLSSILDLEICSHHDFEVKKPFIGERRRQKTVALWVASKSSFFSFFAEFGKSPATIEMGQGRWYST